MNSICGPIALIYAGLVTLLALLAILLALTAVFSSKPTRRKAAAEILRLLLPGSPRPPNL